MSSGINILFQFPTQCVQTQIWHELKKKKKRKKKDMKSQKDFTETVSHSAEDTVLFQKHGPPLEPIQDSGESLTCTAASVPCLSSHAN